MAFSSGRTAANTKAFSSRTTSMVTAYMRTRIKADILEPGSTTNSTVSAFTSPLMANATLDAGATANLRMLLRKKLFSPFKLDRLTHAATCRKVKRTSRSYSSTQTDYFKQMETLKKHGVCMLKS